MRLVHKRLFAIVLSICFLTAFTASGEAAGAKENFPSLEPSFTFRKQTEGEVLSGLDMMECALEFSECRRGSADWNSSMDKFKNLLSLVNEESVLSLEEEKRAEAILSLMYSNLLVQYEEKQTRLDPLFKNGRYNCVSSSIIYAALSREAGLKVFAQVTPVHCFCSVYINGKKIDVETTNPLGFNPGVKRNLESSDKGYRYAIVPKANYRNRHEVTDRMLLSLVARNLCSTYIDKKDYKSAVPLAAARKDFLKDDIEIYDGRENDGRKDFDLVCTNYAVSLQRKSLYEEALLWLDSVIARYGMTDEIKKFYDTAIFNATLMYCKNNDFEAARSCYRDRAQYLSGKRISDIEKNILTMETDYQLSLIEDYTEKIDYLNKRRSREDVKSNAEVLKRVDQLQENVWITMINVLTKSGNHLDAADAAALALQFLPNSKTLGNVYNQCMNNYASTVHNSFAKMANAGKYEEAEIVLNEGLKNYPDSKVLLNDVKKLESLRKAKK